MMKFKNVKYNIIIILSFTVTIFFSCSSNVKFKNTPLVNDGILDLRNWDLKNDGPVKLDGEWNFFWKKFVLPEKINDERANKIKVPNLWSQHKIDQTYLNRNGYATYHLKILLNPIDTSIAIKFPIIGSAYETYINGKKLNQCGKVGKSIETMVAAYRPEVVDFIDSNNELDIVIYVSNFHQGNSGIWESLYFGNSRDLTQIREKNINETFLMIGIFLILFLYHIGLLVLRPKEKLPLYFAIGCFMLAVRNSVMGEIPILDIFPEMPLTWIKTIEYLTFYLFIPTFFAFVYTLFTKESSRIIFIILNVPIIILSVATILLPIQIFTLLIIIGQGIFLILCVYTIYISIMTIINKREGSLIFFMGLCAIVLFGSNDILYSNRIINTGFYMSYGLLVFIFSQSFILSAKFSKAFYYVEKLTISLKSKNKELHGFMLHLEEKVEKRTEELQNLNKDLQKTKNALWGEMQLAKKIQTVLLPKNPQVQGHEVSAFMQTAADVGGDYYDIINTSGRNWIVIGDVSGHGVSAGLIMMMAQSSIRSNIIANPDIKPSKLLRIVNKTIGHNIKLMNENKFMTITALSIKKDGNVLFSGRHEDILIYRNKNKTVEVIKTNGICISPFQLGNNNIDLHFSLDIGDVLLLYTDGLTEAWLQDKDQKERRSDRDMYSDKRLIEVFQKSSQAGVLEKIKEGILESLTAYECLDDTTMVLLKRV